MSDSSYFDAFDNDDLSDIELFFKAVEYDQSLQAGSPHTRNPINYDCDFAEERFRADNFGANEHFIFFVMRPDATGQMSFSGITKYTSVHQLAYDTSPDALDEYLQMGKHTTRDCLDHFTTCVIELFMPEFLRKLDFNDMEKLYTTHNAVHGFLKLLGSIDFVASYDLWTRHAYFRVAGANKDLIVLNNSPLFDKLLNDIAPIALFQVNGVGFDNWYYLADGIHPQWANFVKSFTVARDEKNAIFKWRQEVAQKDIEKAFGVLQGPLVRRCGSESNLVEGLLVVRSATARVLAFSLWTCGAKQFRDEDDILQREYCTFGGFSSFKKREAREFMRYYPYMDVKQLEVLLRIIEAQTKAELNLECSLCTGCYVRLLGSRELCPGDEYSWVL
ncbi:reverse transcriptase domain-containing protein [Tanacetum coccineum]|uniref:Reverse transcriptase domain-containing protein n=1 Tax=Tanacetum coccineum TaxID=301880 RepID=A0ABQ5D0L1_9ASTR